MLDEQGPAIDRVDLATGNVTRVLTLDRKPSVDAGLNISPDERWLILTRVDHSNCDLMLAERVP